MGSSWKIPYPLTHIEKEEDLKGAEITLENLRSRGGTFAVQCKGVDRCGRKIYNNRIGMQTNLGDIQINLWKSLVRRAIEQLGEKAMFNHLLVWASLHCKWLHSKQEVEQYALELHASRIFDNPLWVDFMPFNRKYRPELLQTVDTVTVVNTCCNKPYQIPRERYEDIKGKASCCEHCGRHGPYQLAGGMADG